MLRRSLKSGVIILVGAAAFVLPSRLAAQGTFEGVITVTVASNGERGQHTLSIKGPMWRADMEVDGERNSLIRDQGGRLISLIDTERIYVVLWSGEMDVGDALQFTELGRRETVAGYECRYYRVRDSNGVMDGNEVCVTTALGFVGFSPAGPLSAANEQGIRRQFSDGFLILKSLDSRGNVGYEISKIERKSLNDDLFVPPSGYQEVKLPGIGGPR